MAFATIPTLLPNSSRSVVEEHVVWLIVQPRSSRARVDHLNSHLISQKGLKHLNSHLILQNNRLNSLFLFAEGSTPEQPR